MIEIAAGVVLGGIVLAVLFTAVYVLLFLIASGH